MTNETVPDRKTDRAPYAISTPNAACDDARSRENGFESSPPHVLGHTCPSISVLGVPVSVLTMEAAVTHIMGYVERRQAQYVCIRDVHGVMRAVYDPEIMRAHHNAAMVAPDGMPLVWISRWRTGLETGRVNGADLVDTLCHAGQGSGLRHFFYGGKPGIAEAMIEKLRAKYRNICVVGSYSPPFRPLTEEEDREIVARINASGAQVVWVGISTPKQELWMQDHVDRIRYATLIGVGAAFDIHSGAIARAPKWMQRNGLEWLFRLSTEPRRLWRRWLVLAPIFVIMVIGEQVTLYLARASFVFSRSPQRSKPRR